MNTNTLLGVILIVVGVVLLSFGFNSTQHVVDQAMETATGRYTENTMIYIIGGLALTVGGLALAFMGKKS